MTYKKVSPQGYVRIGFLGCGYATRIHGKTLSRFDNLCLYFASTNREKAEKYNKQYYGKGAFGSYDELINNDHVNVVFIATPPINHLELTLKALKAGKHVIVEKPPFISAVDFEKVRKAKEESQTQVLIAENYYYKPVAKKLRELLHSGVIGQPLFLFVNATKTQKTDDWRDDPDISGGGALFEGGIHWVNFMVNLGFEIEEVQGLIPKSGSENSRSHQLTFKYKEGPVGTLLYSWEVNTSLKGLRISRVYGTEGSITFESNGVFIFVRGNKTKFIWPGLTDIAGYKGMFRDFFNALRKGEDPEFSFEMAKSDVLLIEKASLKK